ncbi:MAG: hypothetical protein WCO23_01620 [bacterium]
MQGRNSYNTENLQKKFPEVYRDFFSKCQRVSSAPNSFLWAGEFSGFYEDGLLISQKLPFRVYVGIEETSDNKIQIDDKYLTYDFEEDNFVSKVFDSQLIIQFKIYLEQYLAKKKFAAGINVHFLTEAPLGHGLGSNGALATALSILISSKTDFDSRFSLARQILSGSQNGYSSGISAFIALHKSSEPILFHSQKENYSAHTISEIAAIKEPQSWPIDFGLIYSGIETNSENVILATEHTMKELHNASENINTLLKEYSHSPFKKTFLNMLNMTTALMANGFAKIYSQGVNDNALNEFFITLNQYQNLLHILNISAKTSDIIYRKIHEIANKEINGSGSGAKISGIGKGGSMLFAIPYGAHRKDIFDMIEDLRANTKKNIRLEYASWLDGIGGKPAQIEQDISIGIVSKFLSQDVVMIKFYNHGQISRQIVTNEHFNNLAKNIDIVIDTSKGKLLIGGSTLTSKDLPSQKATAIILTHLLSIKNYELMNSDIADSYGSSRYDLHSKIVLPLIKIVKRNTKRDLQLKITGGTCNDYQLNLNLDNISIALSEKKI